MEKQLKEINKGRHAVSLQMPIDDYLEIPIISPTC